MIGRNKRGNPRASIRVRLAVAAAVLVGGGAAGVAAVAASHQGTTATQSAGYTTGRWMSYTGAMSSAMNGWNHSPNRSIVTISQMKPMSTWYSAPWHTHTIALQRGTVVATARNQIAVRSANGALKLWYLNHGTKTLNVASNPTAQSAWSGGTMGMPAHMNMRTKGLAKGDLVFVFGERVHGMLIAQLVLFVAPLNFTPQVTPTATPSQTFTPATAPTTQAPLNNAPAQTGNTPAFSGNNS